MGPLGADPDALRSLAGGLRSATRTVDDLAVGLERRLRSAGWQGPDATNFATDWQRRLRPLLLELSDRWRRAAGALDRQAEEQIRASAGSAGAPPPAAPGAVATPEAGGVRMSAPAAPPTSVTQYLAGSEITAGVFTLGLHRDLEVSSLGRGRSLVVATGTERAGVAGTVGAGGRIAQLSVGATGEGSATVARVVRQEYDVADDEVWSTVGRIEAERAAGRVGDALAATPSLAFAATAAEAAVSVWDWALDRLAGVDVDLDAVTDRISIAPEPARVEDLTEIALVGSAGASLGGSPGASGDAEAAGRVRIGESRRDGRIESTVIELEGALTAELQGSLAERLGVHLPGSTGAAASLRIEIPVHPVDGVDLLLSAEVEQDGVLSRTDSHVAVSELGATRAFGQLHGVLAHLADGDLDAAGDAVRDIELPVDEVRSTTSRMQITDATLAGDAAVGNGAGVALAGEGGSRRYDLLP